MALLSFMKPLNSNQILMNFDQVPDKGFIDANMVREICKIQIRLRSKDSNIQRGGPDVFVQRATGEKGYITRAELASNYTHLNGKKIKIAFLRNHCDYMVTRECTEPFKVLKLPDNCQGSLSGKGIKPGSYVVCKTNSDGSLARDTMAVMTPRLFRKMFKIPLQNVIKRHMDGVSSRLLNINLSTNNNFDNQEIASGKVVNTPRIRLGGLAKKPEPQMANTPNIQNKPNVNISSNVLNKPNTVGGLENNNVQQQKSLYNYRATHRVVNMMNKQLVGFVIQEISSGKSKQMNVEQVRMMCEKKLIENIMLVNKENSNIKFLRGNGIRIESLPEVLA